jgi:hypothetical protein
MTMIFDGTAGITLPSGAVSNTTSTVVGISDTQTLTNKSLVASQLTGTQTIPRGTLPTGSVLQVVSASITGENATSSTTFTSAFLSASITPTSATSKVLAIVNGASFGVSGNAEGFFTIDRSGTNLGNGTGGLGRVWNQASSNFTFVPGILMVLDSPATTSSITYTVQYRQTNAAQNVYIGGGAGKSSIVLMEIAA